MCRTATGRKGETMDDTRIEVVGACRFCGQTKMIKASPGTPAGEIDERVTLDCNCREAVIYQNRKKFRDRAYDLIDTVVENQEVNEVMKQTADAISEYKIESAAMVSGERKYTISRGPKGPKVSVVLTHKVSVD